MNIKEVFEKLDDELCDMFAKKTACCVNNLYGCKRDRNGCPVYFHRAPNGIPSVYCYMSFDYNVGKMIDEPHYIYFSDDTPTDSERTFFINLYNKYFTKTEVLLGASAFFDDDFFEDDNVEELLSLFTEKYKMEARV